MHLYTKKISLINGEGDPSSFFFYCLYIEKQKKSFNRYLYAHESVLTLSVRATVRPFIRPSETFCFIEIVKSHCWNFKNCTFPYTYSINIYTVKPVLSGHSKINKTKIFMTNGSLMKVKSIAECPLEHSAILLACIKR